MLNAVNFWLSGEMDSWKKPELRSMEVRNTGFRSENYSVRSCKSGKKYRKSLHWEFRYRKSQQNLNWAKLFGFWDRLLTFGLFLFDTSTIGLVIGISSVSCTGAMIPCWSNSSRWSRKMFFLSGGNLYGCWCLGLKSGFKHILCWITSVYPKFGFSSVTNKFLCCFKQSVSCCFWSNDKWSRISK